MAEDPVSFPKFNRLAGLQPRFKLPRFAQLTNVYGGHVQQCATMRATKSIWSLVQGGLKRGAPPYASGSFFN